MSIPAVDEATLFVYQKGARHHHKNEEKTDPLDATFELLIFAVPEQLGVRIKVRDELVRGSAFADVAVVYEWDRPATPDDDLDSFAVDIAIPQVLSCVSTVLSEAAISVGSRAPFYGINAIDQLVHTFHNRKRSISDLLAERIKAAADQPSPED